MSTEQSEGAGRELDAGKQLYPVGDLARLAEVSPRTVRYYEEIGLLRTARRFAGGRRAFDGDALERLHFIGRLKRLGLSLAEIRHLNDVFAARHSTQAMLRVLDGVLGEHLETIDRRLGELHQLRGEIGDYRGHLRQRLNGGAGADNGARVGNGGSPGHGNGRSAAGSGGNGIRPRIGTGTREGTE